MFRRWGCEQLGTKEDKRAEIEPGINKLENLPPLSSNANHLLFKGDLDTFLDNFNEYKHDTVQDVVTLFPLFGKWKRLRIRRSSKPLLSYDDDDNDDIEMLRLEASLNSCLNLGEVSSIHHPGNK